MYIFFNLRIHIHIFYMIFYNSSKCMHAPFSSRFKRHQENNSSPECIHAPPQDNKNTIALKSRGCEPYNNCHTPLNRSPLPQFGKYSSSFAVNFSGVNSLFQGGCCHILPSKNVCTSLEVAAGYTPPGIFMGN